MAKYKVGDLISDGDVVLEAQEIKYNVKVVGAGKDPHWNKSLGQYLTYDIKDLDKIGDLDVNGSLKVLYGSTSKNSKDTK